MSIARLYDFLAGQPIRSGEVDAELNQLVIAANEAAVAVGGLRFVRGTVNSDGTIAAGSGFTVSKAANLYTVTFSTPFSAVPSVPVSAALTFVGFVSAKTITGAAVVVDTRDTANNSADRAFCFVAAGPV